MINGSNADIFRPVYRIPPERNAMVGWKSKALTIDHLTFHSFSSIFNYLGLR